MVRPKWFDEVDVIYCRMQVERQHWVGLVIDLKKWEVIVLDCKRKSVERRAGGEVHRIHNNHAPVPYSKAWWRMLTQRLDPMTMSRPNLQFNLLSLGMFVLHD